MTAHDPQEAVLLMLGCFFALMALWCGLEWAWRILWRGARVRRWVRRVRRQRTLVGRYKNDLRSTVRPV